MSPQLSSNHSELRRRINIDSAQRRQLAHDDQHCSSVDKTLNDGAAEQRGYASEAQ